MTMEKECGRFLIEKHGLYYRPNAAGYTGIKADAGRYSFEDAVLRVGPNGPDGPQDFGLRMWAEADAPEYSPSCNWEAKLRHQAKTAEAEVIARRAEVERLGAIIASLEARVSGLPSNPPVTGQKQSTLGKKEVNND